MDEETPSVELGPFEEPDQTDVWFSFPGGSNYSASWSESVPSQVVLDVTPDGVHLFTPDWWGIFPSEIRYLDEENQERSVTSWHDLPGDARYITALVPSLEQYDERTLTVSADTPEGRQTTSYLLMYYLDWSNGRDKLVEVVTSKSGGRAATRLSDTCTGHGCFPPRANISASGDVFINGRGAHRLNDGWSVHCCGQSCHSGTMAAGSGTVFVNGRPLARIADSINCGSASAVGSPNVVAG